MAKPDIPSVNEREMTLKKWVNRPTVGEEGFTAVHFASFHGNLTMIRYLIDRGANVFATNRHKINMLHVAA
jgi:ankyrin repeat protein